MENLPVLAATLAQVDVAGSWTKANVVPKGSAVWSSAGDLSAESGISCILHACTGTMGRNTLPNGEPTLESVGRAVANAIELALVRRLQQVRVPLIGGDIFLARIGASLEQLAGAIVTSAVAARGMAVALELVFCDINERCVRAFQGECQRLAATGVALHNVFCVSGSLLAVDGWKVEPTSTSSPTARQDIGIVNAAHVGLYFGGGLSGVIGRACGSKRQEVEASLMAVARDWRLSSALGVGMRSVSSPVVQALLGCAFGQALGDAFGLSTEFLSKQEIVAVYGVGADIPFPDFKRNPHNSRWAKGDWTDDFDQSLLAIEAIVEDLAQESHPTTLEQRFAKKLHTWVHQGFAELGDTSGMGLGATTARVIGHADFLTQPTKAARAVWEDAGRSFKPNGAVMRTAMIGALAVSGDGEQRMIDYTRRICTVTHADPLCMASCLVVTLLVARTSLGDNKNSELLVQAVLRRVLELVPELPDADRADLVHHCRIVDDIEELRLDEPGKIGYTLKCVAAGLWGYRSHTRNTSFEETLQQVAKEGGDSDTNGAVCGALMGCRIGYNALPQAWLQALPHRAWAEARVGRFLKAVL